MDCDTKGGKPTAECLKNGSSHVCDNQPPQWLNDFLEADVHVTFESNLDSIKRFGLKINPNLENHLFFWHRGDIDEAGMDLVVDDKLWQRATDFVVSEHGEEMADDYELCQSEHDRIQATDMLITLGVISGYFGEDPSVDMDMRQGNSKAFWVNKNVPPEDLVIWNSEQKKWIPIIDKCK